MFFLFQELNWNHLEFGTWNLFGSYLSIVRDTIRAVMTSIRASNNETEEEEEEEEEGNYLNHRRFIDWPFLFLFFPIDWSTPIAIFSSLFWRKTIKSAGRDEAMKDRNGHAIIGAVLLNDEIKIGP